MAYVYKIINDINQKVYIGLTYNSLEDRWKSHLHDRKYFDRPIYRAMNKYGIKHFHIELVEECDDTIVNEREIYWINHYNSYYDGYNATLGGEGSTKYNKQEILELYQQGKTLTEICKILKCDPLAPRRALKSYGINILENQNLKNKELYGKKCQAISKDGLVTLTFSSLSDGARYIINNKLSIDSLTGIQTHISHVCNGKRKTAYGFIWKFI